MFSAAFNAAYVAGTNGWGNLDVIKSPSMGNLLCWTSSDVQGFAMRGSTPRVRLRTEVMSLFLSFPSQWMMTVPG